MLLQRIRSIVDAIFFVLQACILFILCATMLSVVIGRADGGALRFPVEYLWSVNVAGVVLFVLLLYPMSVTILTKPFNLNQFYLRLFTWSIVAFSLAEPRLWISFYTTQFASTPIKTGFILERAECSNYSGRGSYGDRMFVTLRHVRSGDVIVFNYRDDNCLDQSRWERKDFSGDLRGQQVWLIGRGWKLGEYYFTIETPEGTVTVPTKWNQLSQPLITSKSKQ